MSLMDRRAVVAAGAALASNAIAQSASLGAYPMPAQITNLFLLENLEDASTTRELAESDRNALRAVADWTKTFVAKPHRDLGRAGPVCPFVPVAWEHKTLWLAAERSAGRSATDVIQLIDGYKRLLLAAQPVDGADANNKSIVVVFTDLPAAQAKDFFSGVLQQNWRSILCGRWAGDGTLLRGQRWDRDIQPELSTIHIARPFSVDEACGYQRLEVFLEQRRLAQALGASLWRARSRSSR
jgi:hypothetical protein